MRDPESETTFKSLDPDTRLPDRMGPGTNKHTSRAARRRHKGRPGEHPCAWVWAGT